MDFGVAAKRNITRIFKTATSMEENQERIVKGIWIPIEIWKDKNLTWNEKILFLEIDSYTSQERDCFFSNLYISDLLGISETNANKTLSSLINKGYVIKTKFDGRHRYVKSALSYSTTLPCQERQPSIINNDNNINNNGNSTNNINNKTINKEEKKNIEKENSNANFEEVWLMCGRKGSKKNAKKRWDALTNEQREKAKQHVPFYYKSKERQYLKDLEGYLNGHYFDSVVYDKKGNMLYDPDKFVSGSTYQPNGRNVFYDETMKMYCYDGDFDFGSRNNIVYDGYEDNERPNGAMLELNNGRGFIEWHSDISKWNIKLL